MGRGTATGKALLETRELIFRSEAMRLVIPFAEAAVSETHSADTFVIPKADR